MMIPNRKWRMVAFLLLLAVSEESFADSLIGSRPNIVIVMTDDQGYGDLSCHGHPVLKTPNLDRLSAESLRFTSFFVSPTCAPTRAAMLTGRHEFKSGVTHTINERERLALSAFTLPAVLKKAGYSTGIFGKWHLGDEDAYQPGQRGFDETFIHGGGGIGQTFPGSCGDAPRNKYFDPVLRQNGTFVRTKGYCTDLFFDRAIAWMGEQSKQGNQPFFAMITPNAPHAPLISPGPMYDRLFRGKTIADKPLSAEAIRYLAMIANIDENVGKLLDALESRGIAQKTLVIYLTDNGGTFTQLYSAGMRGGKGTPYEGGTRVSCFWRWPSRWSAGRDISSLAAHIDLFPTLVELAGGSMPTPELLDGRSLVPLLHDPNAGWPDRYLFTHVGRWELGQVDKAKFRSCAVRSHQFRFVNNAELYDLSNDPAETTNVINQYPNEVASMRQAYDRWWIEARAGMVNEEAVGPKTNPFHDAYYKQFGVEGKQ
jgi:arylsulfatase A-like enzyme